MGYSDGLGGGGRAGWRGAVIWTAGGRIFGSGLKPPSARLAFPCVKIASFAIFLKSRTLKKFLFWVKIGFCKRAVGPPRR